jgi:hypothetical protein
MLLAFRVITAAASAKDMKLIERSQPRTTESGKSTSRPVATRSAVETAAPIRRPPSFAELQRGSIRDITTRATERLSLGRTPERGRVGRAETPAARGVIGRPDAIERETLRQPVTRESLRGETPRETLRAADRVPIERADIRVTRDTTTRLPAERTTPRETTTRGKIRVLPLPRVPLPGEETVPTKGLTDKEKREIIKKAAGSTTYNMGRLHGKDVWWTHLDNDQVYVTLGEQPEGTRILADGPGSTYKTTQRIGSQAGFKPFSIRHGAVMSRVTPTKAPQGAQNAFAPVGRSVKVGKMYVADVGGAIGFSRKPIKRGRRRK